MYDIWGYVSNIELRKQGHMKIIAIENDLTDIKLKIEMHFQKH